MDRKNSWGRGSHRRREPAFWLSVLTELQSSGLKDIFIGCRDGLTGLAEAKYKLELKAREVGCALSQHQQIMASSPGQSHPLICFPR